MKFDFNALNFEVLDANTNAYPDIFINQNGVTFTKKVLDDLNYPAFVLCQLDAKNKVFAVRMCKSSEQRGYKFSKPKGEQKATVSNNNMNSDNSSSGANSVFAPPENKRTFGRHAA